MRLCRVLGTITSTIKHPAFNGLKLMVVQPVDEADQPTAKSFIAVDKVQAGAGDRVLVMSEGVIFTGNTGVLTQPHAPTSSLVRVGVITVSRSPVNTLEVVGFVSPPPGYGTASPGFHHMCAGIGDTS